ncbi:MAG: class I SAM-dependent methyltransferase [Bacteroidetes bacterium]|jgi:SAM-dependent methyltransferase|nr:class I SAM-dependent methyltransferase [Bacteroidota bacterium]
MSRVWDQRYRTEAYAYGTAPNDFLASIADQIPRGPVLCVGEGEGRNAVFLAERGHAVTAIDWSPVGLAKAEQLAASRGVHLETVCADLAEVPFAPSAWSGIVEIFVHLPAPVRTALHEGVKKGLRPGGVLVVESYTPKQLEHGTGGPTDPELLPTIEDLRRELSGLDYVIAREIERDIHEGVLHDGWSAVAQVLARKPA